MADAEQLSRLLRIGQDWNTWRKKHPGVEVDLTEADLRGKYLSDANLAEVNLRGAHLDEARLRGVNLRRANLRRANLRRANLRGVYLVRARIVDTDLIEASVIEADLRQTSLRRADLTGACLCGTILNDARLSDVHLRRADLSGAQLRGAQLYDTDLRQAQLGRANFSAAQFWSTRFGETVFADIDLRDVDGLDRCSFDGPCMLDYFALARSWPLPEIFLRGCGFPDALITYLPSLLTDGAIQFYSCFISYSHADKSFARRLHDTLQGRGIRCWLDERQLLPGDDVYHRVDEGIRLWDKVLLCCSENSPRHRSSRWYWSVLRSRSWRSHVVVFQ
jgi:uncharacterized protein YjbI with pentapeptide repeats